MTIRLYWSGGGRHEVNLGDTLSPMVVEIVSGQKVVYSHPATCDLAAIGSILDKVVSKRWGRLSKMRFDPIHVWGSGSFGPGTIKNHKGLLIHAVRGPLTRDTLQLEGGLPLGDPGLLVGLWGIKAKKRYRWGIIPHVVDYMLPCFGQIISETPHAVMINLSDPDIVAVLRTVASCDFVISSSLHGLVVADAFGIPNIWARVSPNVYGGDWKFHDYMKSMNRRILTPVSPYGNLTSLENNAGCSSYQAVAQRQNDLLCAFKSINL